jgi:hypothetical protein
MKIGKMPNTYRHRVEKDRLKVLIIAYEFGLHSKYLIVVTHAKKHPNPTARKYVSILTLETKKKVMQAIISNILLSSDPTVHKLTNLRRSVMLSPELCSPMPLILARMSILLCMDRRASKKEVRAQARSSTLNQV